MRRLKAEAQVNSKTPARRMLPPGRLRRILRWSGALVVIGILGGGAWLIQRQSLIPKSQAAIKSFQAEIHAFFDLRLADILVVGRKRTTQAEILSALGLQRGSPIAELDLELARAKLETLPWVKTATIERHLPGILSINIVERDAIAQWQRDGKFVLVDREGVEIVSNYGSEFSSLPVVIGPDAPANAASLFEILSEEPDLWVRVKAATRVGKRRWNVRLDDFEKGIDIRLPEETAEAWSRLADIERTHKLLERKVTMVDLRQTDRLVVKTIDGSVTQPSLSPPKKRPGDKEA
jgi:cell division protein FtsQ